MSYMIINDQHKFLAKDPTKQISYGRHASKMGFTCWIYFAPVFSLIYC